MNKGPTLGLSLWWSHYNDVIMGAISSQITSLTIVYSTVYSGEDQRKFQSSASLAFVRGIHRWPVNFPHKGPVTRKMFSYDDVIMGWWFLWISIFAHINWRDGQSQVCDCSFCPPFWLKYGMCRSSACKPNISVILAQSLHWLVFTRTETEMFHKCINVQGSTP